VKTRRTRAIDIRLILLVVTMVAMFMTPGSAVVSSIAIAEDRSPLLIESGSISLSLGLESR